MCRRAEGLMNLPELTQLLNLVFSNSSFLPFSLTEEQMQMHIDASGIDLSKSVVLVDEAPHRNTYVGFSFLGLRFVFTPCLFLCLDLMFFLGGGGIGNKSRGSHGWLGGVGVINLFYWLCVPPQRNQSSKCPVGSD